MNDNELIAWQVVATDDNIEHTCLKQSTAEYLRDWCNAIQIDKFKDAITRHPESTKVFEKAIERVSHYVVECEVIVG